jgi:adenylate cyclase
MRKKHVQRRLAAILAADLVGYSRMMDVDETGTLARFKTFVSELFDPKISNFGGRVFKRTGDGALAEFGSAVDAVKSAIEIQIENEQRNSAVPKNQQIIMRIGVNLGDVIVEGDDIYGGGVNVAARLEGLCEPGMVYISGSVFDQVSGKLDARFDDLGERIVKNISKPVRVYRVNGDPDENPLNRDTGANVYTSNKPSIAVLPFDNLSGDPDQEYFADGMTEDIITGLARFGSLFVIARNSTFGYKGKSPDVRKVAQDLNVRYVLEGSVRRFGDRIRITGQLVDAATGNHLWAERYDRELEDIFAVQDEITETIVAAIAPEIDLLERQRAQRKSPGSFDVWSLYQQGLAGHQFAMGKECERVIEQFDKVCELDPTFALAFAMAASSRVRYVLLFSPENHTEILDHALEKARKGIALDNRNSMCFWAYGRVLTMLGQLDGAISSLEDAILFNPNDAMAHYYLAIALGSAGRLEEALVRLDHAIRLNPHDVSGGGFHGYRSFILFDLERYEEAVESGSRAIRSPYPLSIPFEVTIAALVKLQRREEATVALGNLLEHTPGTSVSKLRKRPWIGRPKTKELYFDALRKAGLPE